MGFFDKVEKKPDRFIEKSSQSYGMGAISVMVDTVTGVNYIMGYMAFEGGFSIVPLIGPDGKVVVDDISEYND